MDDLLYAIMHGCLIGSEVGNAQQVDFARLTLSKHQENKPEYVAILTDEEEIIRATIKIDGMNSIIPRDKIELALKEEYCVKSIEVINIEPVKGMGHMNIEVVAIDQDDERQEYEFMYQFSALY